MTHVLIKKLLQLFSYNDVFGIKQPTKADKPFFKNPNQTKPSLLFYY